jgi:hypothetical protein
MIAAYNFYAYRWAAQNGSQVICDYLLSQSIACFAYAEQYLREYDEITAPFIAKKLGELSLRAVNNAEEAKLCFYIVRHFIRRNNRESDESLRFLLNIPAVRALAHQEITQGQSNELIRLALSTNNHTAAGILLEIPEVLTLAEQNDYYHNELQGGLDLAHLAHDQESSITGLTPGEQRRLEAVTRHYHAQLDLKDKEKVEQVMMQLRNNLEERYETYPARFKNKNGIEIKLPMDYASFKNIQKELLFDKEDIEEASKAYYQHKDHSAWRYLAKPNPWMSTQASYVYINDEHTERWSTFEDYQPLIALLWLAACDSTIKPIDGSTLEGRIALYIAELAYIGRAHNWDKKRLKTDDKGQVLRDKEGKALEEEYDDLQGDKPSCFSGVKRRLFQAVLDHPLLTFLTKDKLLQEIRDFARNFFSAQLGKLSVNEKTKIKEAFDDYIINITQVSETSKEYLASLNIPPEQLNHFDYYLSQRYGDQYSKDMFLVKLVHDSFALKPEHHELSLRYHVLMLDGLVHFNQMLEQQEIADKHRKEISHEIYSLSNDSSVQQTTYLTSRIGFFSNTPESGEKEIHTIHPVVQTEEERRQPTL